MKRVKNTSTKVTVLASFILCLVIAAVYVAIILFNANQVGSDRVGVSPFSTNVKDVHDESYDKTKDADNTPTMQSFDKTTLANINETIKLRDARDGNIYTVKKLADGNVWMTQNLRIINKVLTSSDSDVSSSFTIPVSSSSGFSKQDTNNAYVDSTYGGYYTFYTATAGWGTSSVTSGNSPSSICPKGWRLPTGGSRGELETLYKYYNSPTLMQGDPGFILSGYVHEGSVLHQGSEGDYWSSTVHNACYAYLELSNSVAYPAFDGDEPLGLSVRCIAR